VVAVETSWVVKHVLWLFSRLGGIVVSMLATGPKGCGFEPGQGDGFLRAIKQQHTFLSDGK
jgi:hypothetical protein